jgi:nicotinamide riboside transporter PnuC
MFSAVLEFYMKTGVANLTSFIFIYIFFFFFFANARQVIANTDSQRIHRPHCKSLHITLKIVANVLMARHRRHFIMSLGVLC